MGMGGGGGAAKQAAATEAQRQADIQSGVARVNSVYDSPDRAKQRDEFLQAMLGKLTGDVNRQKVVATRNMKFSNARAGLSGGSQEIAGNKVLQQDYSKGLLDAQRKAQGSFADLVNSDEASRNQLTGLVQNGLDTGTAATRAAESLKTNLGAAQAGDLANGTWDVFGNSAGIWKTQSEAYEKRKAQTTPIGSVWSA